MINSLLGLVIVVLFAQDHLLIQYFIRSIKQGDLEAFPGLFRRSSLLTDTAEKRWRCMTLCFPVFVRGVD